MNASLLSLRITDLHRDAEGVWRAYVYQDGESRPVDRSQGCWRVTPAEDAGGWWQEVTASVAAELQRRVKKLERANAPKEDVMSAAKKPAAKTAAKKAATRGGNLKGRRPAAAKPAAKKPAAKGSAPRLSREEAQAKAAAALTEHEAGTSYADIAKAQGWANPGVAWNAVARAKKARDGAAK